MPSGLKRTPQVIATLFWQPFEVQFGGILTELKRNKQIFEDELLLADRVLANERAVAAAQERRETLEKMTKFENVITKEMERQYKGRHYGLTA